MKYKSLIRLIDVCIPVFGSDEPANASSSMTRTTGSGFQLTSGLFGQAETEYNIDEDDEAHNGDDDDGPKSHEELFFEAEDGSVEVRQFIT